MTKTEQLDKLARDGEERLLLARTLDKLETARRKNIPAATGFLSPSERVSVENLIAANGHPPHLFFGGYPGAERTICLFLPDWQEPEDALALAMADEGPVKVLRCTYNADGGITHRDILGAILGQGITREKVGDLLVGPESCDVLVLEELADYLLLHLDSAGRTRLKTGPISLSQISPPEVRIKTIRDTVATPRLDALVACAFSTSRSKAADFISAGRVQLNHRECTKADKAVEEGDVLSCRGLGKAAVRELGGRSKKGRIMVVLERYL